MIWGELSVAAFAWATEPSSTSPAIPSLAARVGRSLASAKTSFLDRRKSGMYARATPGALATKLSPLENRSKRL